MSMVAATGDRKGLLCRRGLGMSKEDLALAAVPRFVAIGLQRQLGRKLLARGLKWVVNARLPQPAMPASGRFLPSASDAFGQKPFGIPLWVALPRQVTILARNFLTYL